MKRLLDEVAGWLWAIVVCSPLLWVASPCHSQGGMGPGPGTVHSTSSYQGPVDVVANVTVFWSCSRTASAALASTSTSMCDLVAVTGGASVCTLRGSSTGFADLAGTYCAGTTPSAACAAASGGSCKISKAYNQIAPGTADMVQATLANMPAIVFADLNGLPTISFTSGPSQSLATSSAITQAAPYGISAVFRRPAGGGSGAYISSNNTATEIRGAGTANNVGFACGTAVAVAGNDDTWHAANGSCSSTVAQDAIRIDGTDTTGQTAGTTGPSGSTMRMGVSNAGTFITAKVAEAMLFSIAPDATQRSNLNTNMHSPTVGYNF